MPGAKRSIIVGVCVAAILAGGYVLTQRREWIQNKLLDALVARFAPHLPFTIDSYRLSRNLDHFEARLHRESLVVTLSGPVKALDIGGEAGWEINYRPEVEIAGWVKFRLLAQIGIRGRQLSGLRITLDPASAPKVSLRPLGIELVEPDFVIEAVPGESFESKIDFFARSLTWTDPKKSTHAISAEQLRIQARHGVEQTSASLSAKSGELLWDELYRELPLALLPIQLHATHLGQSSEPLMITVGQSAHPQLHLEVRLAQNLQWSISQLPIEPVLRWAIPEKLEGLQLKGGRLSTRGQLRLPSDAAGSVRIDSADVKVDRLSLRSVAAGVAMNGVEAQGSYVHGRAKQTARLSVSRLNYRHFESRLDPLKIEWTPESANLESGVSLAAEGTTLRIGPTRVAWEPELKITSSLELTPTSLSALAKGWCLPPEKVPPGTAVARFTKIDAGRGYVDPTGSASVDLFQGRIQLNEIGYYDFDTEVPELDFDAEWKGIDLQAMSSWLHFGEILGTLEGHAHEVVFQSTLPTHYHFQLEAKPLAGEHFVEFSPDAMKNVVKLFTGENLDEQIPGIAGWLMFGWPSRVFGGYDVQYAGIKATSENGTIQVETLDPDKVVRETQKRFVLYGPRFKMPLKSTTYPVLIDATAMANFVHQLTRTLKSIQEAKGAPAHEPAEIVCDPPEI